MEQLQMPVLVAAAVTVVCFLFAIWAEMRLSLRRFKGPTLARYTDIYRLQSVWRGQAHNDQLQLHRRHGPGVRLGPSLISISDPSLIHTIYKVKDPFVKGPMYHVNDIATPDWKRISTPFGTRDEAWHTFVTTPNRRMYSMSSLLSSEYRIDATLALFVQQLKTRFSAGIPFDLSIWVQYFAWDAMHAVTFGSPLSFLETGSDMHAMATTNQKAMSYMAIVGQIPWLDYLIDKNPIHRIGPPSFVWGLQFSMGKLASRRATFQKEAINDAPPADMLDQFLHLQASDPTVNDQMIIMWTMDNVIAGSDTVSIAITAVLYHTLRHRTVSEKLTAELGAAKLSQPAKWAEVRDLPYLDAVIRESLRLHPPVGSILERVMPHSGLTLADGTRVPHGVTVGVNPFVVQRDADVFAPDPDKFRPERWLRDVDAGESVEEWQGRLSRMRGAEFAFGFGKRGCKGKELARLEIYKAVATLLSVFEFKLVDPAREWNVENRFFLHVSGVNVMARLRET